MLLSGYDFGLLILFLYYHKKWQITIYGCDDLKLNNILREKGLTAKQVSEQTGIKYGTMLKYSSGERTPGVERAKLIAAVLDMDWWKLIDK